jgi:DNA-binding GntR family transcriptional regulator
VSLPSISTRDTIQRPSGELERVYQQLLAWLMDAVLLPGEFLSEPELAKRCSASRTPVREACMRLMQDRWLIRYPQKGFMVSPITVANIVDLYQFRKLLEGFTVEKVAQSITSEQLMILQKLMESEHSDTADVVGLVSANEAFHLQLAVWAGNERVLEQLKLTLRFARRLDTLYLQMDRSWISHEDILAALAKHHGTEALCAMSTHLDRSMECLIRLFGSNEPHTLCSKQRFS